MVSKRIKQDERGSIARLAVKAKYGDEVENIRKEWQAFADEVYEDVYGEEGLERLNSAPDGWFEQRMNISVRFGGDHGQLSFEGIDSYYFGQLSNLWDRPVRLKVAARRMAHCHCPGVAKVYEHDDPLTKRFNDLRYRTTDLQESVAHARRQTVAALESFGTTARVSKEWPEIMPFVKQVIAVEDLPSVPTVRRTELNELLGLETVLEGDA